MTKPPSFAPQIDFRDFVTELTKPPRPPHSASSFLAFDDLRSLEHFSRSDISVVPQCPCGDLCVVVLCQLATNLRPSAANLFACASSATPASSAVRNSTHASLELPRANCMVQSRNNAAVKSLRFPAFARKHCSIDLSFSFARGALPKKNEQPG